MEAKDFLDRAVSTRHEAQRAFDRMTFQMPNPGILDAEDAFPLGLGLL